MRGDRRRVAMRRTYLSLGLGELAAATVFPVVALTSVDPRLTTGEDRLAFWSALVPLLVILLQAGVYWLLARTWIGRRRMPVGVANAYRGFRVVDVALLAASGLVVLWWVPASPGVVTLVVGVWLFGVVEYANYFVVRLAYPLTRWPGAVTAWRPPRLVRDLRRARR